MASAGWRKRDRRCRRRAARRRSGRSRAGEDVEQLVLALALERDDAQHLARVQVERDVLRASVAEREAARREPRRGVAPLGAARPRPAPVGAAGCSVDDRAPEHQLDDPLLGARGDVDDADGLAVAQHRGAVAQGGDLDQPVGDEDHRPVAAALAADDLEHPLGQVRGQRRGHLVEHAGRRARWPARAPGR